MEDLEEDDSLFDDLPDNCLAHIFSFLPIPERFRLERVCKRWRIISEEGWQDIKEFKINHDYSDDPTHAIMKRCGRFLRKIYICMAWECNCLSIAMKYCQLDQLKEIEIDISGVYIREEYAIRTSNLRELFGKCGNLVAVTITGDLTCYGTYYLSSLNPKILRIKHTGKLRYPASINPDQFPDLKELKLINATMIGNEMKSKKDSLKGLENIHIVQCSIPQNFIQRIRTFTNLRKLVLSQNSCIIKNEDIRYIASDCDKIKKIVLSDSSHMTSECFQDLGKMLSLEVLCLEDFNITNGCDILNLTNVYRLSLQDCEIIDDDGLLELIVNSLNLEKLQILYSNRSVNRTFLEGVGRIFHRGLRDKYLLLVASMMGDAQNRRTLQMEINHPLLELRVGEPSRMTHL